MGEEAFTKLRVRLRTGDDDTPILFQQRVYGAPGEPPVVVEVSGEEHWDVERHLQVLPTDDVQHWSPWRRVANGGPVPVHTPRRYVQFQFEFEGRLFDTRLVDHLRFEYLRPPLADTLRAEAYPRLAEAESPATFRYAVGFRSVGRALGFDQLEVDTNVRAAGFRAVTVNGAPVEFEVLSATEVGFRLGLPLVRVDESVLELTFDLPIFRFGTTFSSRVYNSRFPSVPQATEPGQVVDFGPGDDDATSGLSVAIPEKQIGRLVGEIAVRSRWVSPNGDGINDRLEIACNLLQLVAPAPVSLHVYDLSGRRVGWVDGGERGIGPLALVWDGTTDGGRPATPGIYIWVLQVNADAMVERHSGTVAVVY